LIEVLGHILASSVLCPQGCCAASKAMAVALNKSRKKELRSHSSTAVDDGDLDPVPWNWTPKFPYGQLAASRGRGHEYLYSHNKRGHFKRAPAPVDREAPTGSNYQQGPIYNFEGAGL